MTCKICDDCPFAGELDKIIYEIHVTVDHDPGVPIICRIIGSKLIDIEMDGVDQTHLMTSDTFKGTEEQAFTQARNLAAIFQAQGIAVHRVKIETVPWHPKASEPSPTQYFEAHFAVDPEHVMYPQMLDRMVKINGLHKSRNLMKKGNSSVQMYTYRDYVGYAAFKQRVEVFKSTFAALGANVTKTITEFAIYDSNVDMDAQWLSAKN